ncbi:MAG: Glycerol-3-P acyltransferase [Parcubacteria group bacterium GW2011_GWA1_47_8]|nr:MAG: Glycerol-3-P acyltransferase [Parcubacteria group bacterium GW2011_GWA1_47_8]
MNPFSWTPTVLQTFVYPFTWISFRLFARIKILGKEHIRGHKRGAIFAVNHSSELDPILVPATLNPFSPLMPMFYLARERSFYPRAEKFGLGRIFYSAAFFKMWGAYPISVGTGNYEVTLKYHLSILEQGRSVCIFPEGKKTENGDIGEGKPGVAYLLWRTGVPVIPTAIHGHYLMGARDFIARKHSITISYGKPITREELFGTDVDRVVPTHEELKSATHTIMSRIREMYART